MARKDWSLAGSVLIGSFQELSLALTVLRIHSDKTCPLALAATSMAFKSSVVKRTGTMRPLAWPFGSLGRPGFLVFGNLSLLL